MPESTSPRTRVLGRRIRYRGRAGQIPVFLRRMLRMFFYQNDWKVFPMAAIIAGIVAFLVRSDFFLTMEGTLKGAFALTCVAIWNGCFNSIQVICRERDVLKREHRSGMHITSYMAAHLIYQALLCAGQNFLLIHVFRLVRLSFPQEGLITPWFQLDLGITVFLITYASDMLGLLVSAFVPTTTAAMTVMPFILIFQLVFSGGFFTLPGWMRPLSAATISNYGIVSLCSQADYNSLPLVTPWEVLNRLRDNELGGSVTVEQLLDLLRDNGENGKVVGTVRNTKISTGLTIGEAIEQLLENPKLESFRKKKVLSLFQVGEFFRVLYESGVIDPVRDVEIGTPMTVGDLIDWIAENPDLAELRRTELRGTVSVGQLINIFGEDTIHDLITTKTAEASRNPNFERSPDKIGTCWAIMGGFALLYALAATIVLEFIDRDKR